ncbi:MAG: class I SAM-dependent methyltransferase [Firmicutes bacterium]|nr:class I SAM-dependent methyltransferase [Bacillota bacterium]
MKPDYKNWVPNGLIAVCAAVTLLSLVFVFAFGTGAIVSGTLRTILTIAFAELFILFAKVTEWCLTAHSAFSYNGKRQLSRSIIDGVAEYVSLPDGGVGLDVGCGSGALTIACAKRNPRAEFIGIDKWGREYSEFNRPLCEKNAEAEGVRNVRFEKGDACRLNFADETFDAVTSNYVYHNITGQDKQKLLLETLRVLKKGGNFAIHDIMSPARYGDMEKFMTKLKKSGYERVELIDTTNGKFMTRREARRLMLGGSALLVGIK